MSDSPKSAIDLTNSRIKYGGEQQYSIILSRDGTSFELTFNNQATAAEWYNALKGICISTNFTEQYEMVKLIEKGRFSRVIFLFLPWDFIRIIDLFIEIKKARQLLCC